jgi:hypothetical protein
VWLACRPTIILPSVRALRVTFEDVTEPEPLALALALTTLGFRGSVIMEDVPREGRQRDQICAILQPRVHVKFS